MLDFYNYNLDESIDKIKSFTYSAYDLDFYSSRKIISELYEIPSNLPLKAHVYHGIFITDYELGNWGVISPEPVLCTRQSQVDYLISNGRSKDNTFCTGALFPRYRHFKGIFPAQKQIGTIVFPQHSCLEVDSIVDWEEYVVELKKLPDKFKPINICMHWLDIVNGKHKIFLENGFNVYTAGHANDPDFVDNFYQILRHHKYATSNDASGASLLYAAEFGLSTFIYANSSFKSFNKGREFSNIGVSEKEFEDYCDYTKSFYYDNFPIYPNLDLSVVALSNIKEKLGLDFQSSKVRVKKCLINYYKKQKMDNLKTRVKHYFFKKTQEGIYRKIRLLGFIKLKYKMSPKKCANLLKNSWREVENSAFNNFKNSDIVKSLNESSVCIDCGANVGIITQIFAQKGAVVYSFEPHKGCFDILTKKFAANPKVHIYNKGVLDKNSTMKLYKFEYHDYDEIFFSQGASMFKSNKEIDSNAYDVVEVINLIEFIKSLNRDIDILKLDVEGAEFCILELLINEKLYKNIKHILVETHDETIPEIRELAAKVRQMIKDNNIMNIDLTWV